MRENDIQSIVRKKFRRLKEQNIIKQNILNRNFKASISGEKYVTDITYIPTQKNDIFMYCNRLI